MNHSNKKTFLMLGCITVLTLSGSTAWASEDVEDGGSTLGAVVSYLRSWLPSSGCGISEDQADISSLHAVAPAASATPQPDQRLQNVQDYDDDPDESMAAGVGCSTNFRGRTPRRGNRGAAPEEPRGVRGSQRNGSDSAPVKPSEVPRGVRSSHDDQRPGRAGYYIRFGGRS